MKKDDVGYCGKLQAKLRHVGAALVEQFLQKNNCLLLLSKSNRFKKVMFVTGGMSNLSYSCFNFLVICAKRRSKQIFLKKVKFFF